MSHLAYLPQLPRSTLLRSFRLRHLSRSGGYPFYRPREYVPSMSDLRSLLCCLSRFVLLGRRRRRHADRRTHRTHGKVGPFSPRNARHQPKKSALRRPRRHHRDQRILLNLRAASFHLPRFCTGLDRRATQRALRPSAATQGLRTANAGKLEQTGQFTTGCLEAIAATLRQRRYHFSHRIDETKNSEMESK